MLNTADDKAVKLASAKHKDVAADRPLVRAPLSPDADRLTQMASTLQTQQESLKSREQQMATREKQLDLIYDQIKQKQKSSTPCVSRSKRRCNSSRKSWTFSKERRRRREGSAKATADLREIKRATLEMNGLESKNLKQVAGIYDKMDPDSAAQSIQQMVDKGKLDTAVAILAGMRDRQAANLLTIISNQDASIATQLVDRVRYMRASADSPR